MKNENSLKPTKLFIHATNIHQGGGQVLLNALFQSIPDGQKVVFNLDERMLIPSNLHSNVSVRRSRPTIFRRWLAEKWLADNVISEDIVLCLGNLPPLFKLRAYTIVFIQNRYLIDDSKKPNLAPLVKLRLFLERLWLFSRMRNANEFIVQTPTMKFLLEQKTHGRISVRTIPFVEISNGYERKLKTPQQRDNFNFAYIATGGAHKNHLRLIKAWCLLAEEGLYPSLYITLDKRRYSKLCAKIEAMIRVKNIKVINMGELSHNEVLNLYKCVGALIYPSVYESFGLPLIEARQAGLAIIASELDYVRDIIDPEESFNPESTISIARAVKRFLGITEPELKILDAEKFINRIMECRKA